MPKDLEHFLVVSVEGGVLAGAILSHSSTYALAHYRRYCHELNLDPNDPHSNWDELVEAARTLNDPAANVYGLAFSAKANEEGTFQFLPFLWQAGADLDTLDSPQAREALTLWVDLVQDGHMSEGILGWIQEDVKEQFIAGRAAMMVNGSWQVGRLREEAAEMNWNVVTLPEGPGGGASILGGENYAVTADAENPEAAWNVIQRLVEEDVFMEYMKEERLPSRADHADDPYFQDDPVLAVFTEQLLVARPRPLDWVFRRTYRSDVRLDGPLGHNWEFADARRLLELAQEGGDE
jgi:multiple sugar transport system substrate-binding protein